MGTDYTQWLFEAHAAEIIDHYTEGASVSTNHLLPTERRMESALFCRLLFNMVEVPLWEQELEGWRQNDGMIRLGIW